MERATSGAPTPASSDRFRWLVLAEWTKLRTAPGTARSALVTAGALVVIALLISSGNPGTYDEAPYVDELAFTHRPLTGDGTITARVRTQVDSHPWSMAGLVIKEEPTPGAHYAALMVTPNHGVRLQAEFTIDHTGSAGTVPIWLRLSRSGSTITGYESADGRDWAALGTVELPDLPETVSAGLFVTSPGITRTITMRPAISRATPGRATFDRVQVTGDAAAEPAAWTSQQVGPTGRPATPITAPGPGGVVTLTGSGDIIGQADDGSRLLAAVAGTFFAVIPVVTLGVLTITSEYRLRTIRTTLTACPRRGRVLAAKVTVAGGVAFIGSLLAVSAALALTQPFLKRQGFEPPVYPDLSPTDPTVLRVAVGTAAFLALLAVVGLGVGVMLRNGASAICLAVASVLFPAIAAPFLPPATGTALQRLGPIAGLSVQQVTETDDAFLLPWVGRPWLGVAILVAYAVAVLAGGRWLLRQRDA
jgi:hypothetical protein